MRTFKWLLTLSFSVVTLGDATVQNQAVKETDRNVTQFTNFSELAPKEFQQRINQYLGADLNKTSVKEFIVKFKNSSYLFCNENRNVSMNVSDSNQGDLLKFFESKLKNESACLQMCSVNMGNVLSEACPALVFFKQTSQVPVKTAPLPSTNTQQKLNSEDDMNTPDLKKPKLNTEDDTNTQSLKKDNVPVDTKDGKDIPMNEVDFKNSKLEGGPDPNQELPLEQDNKNKSKLKILKNESVKDNFSISDKFRQELNNVKMDPPLLNVDEDVQPEVNSKLISNHQQIDTKHDQFTDESSHFYLYKYFVVISCLCVVFYFFVYNKKKVLALLIEGRRKNGRRRRYSAAYSRLDTNLEEALASAPSTSGTNIMAY